MMNSINAVTMLKNEKGKEHHKTRKVTYLYTPHQKYTTI